MMKDFKIKLNEEQKVALTLQKTNNVIAFLVFVPASICLIITVDALNYNWTNEVITFLYSSILLIIFYGYTFLSPRIYLFENYNRQSSLIYWLIVFLSNLLTIFLFVHNDALQMVIVPTIPLVISAIGLIAHYNINFNKID
jgi:hypothetical protein